MPGKSPIRLTLLHKTIVVCLLLAPFCAASDHWNYEETHSEVRDFAAGGMVHVRLSVGDLHIRRGDSNKISLHYTVKSRRESHVKDSHVDIDVHGRDADIEFHAPTGGNTQFDVELEVPQNTNLEVHEKVGDLRIEDIEGDKDLQLGVGDIRVAFGALGLPPRARQHQHRRRKHQHRRRQRGLPRQDPEIPRRRQVRTACPRLDRGYFAGREVGSQDSSRFD